MNTNKNDKNKKNEKKLYSEFIYLKHSEYDKLLNLYGSEEHLNIAFGILDAYIGSTGKKYKSYYHVLNKSNWVYKRFLKENTCQTSNIIEFKPEFDIPEGF